MLRRLLLVVLFLVAAWLVSAENPVDEGFIRQKAIDSETGLLRCGENHGNMAQTFHLSILNSLLEYYPEPQ